MNPNIAVFHPQIVHFVVALLIVGVVLRLVSFTGKFSFTGPAAALLILVGTAAAVAAVKSGNQAEGPSERIPGADPVVVAHHDWGHRTRNVFLGVAALEIAALLLTNRRYRKIALLASCGIGLIGLGVLYRSAQLGGELVYGYAGGVGTTTGNPDDVTRLLVAGLYHQAMADRAADRGEAAAGLFSELARRRPDDNHVQLLAVQSILVDREAPVDALEALAAFDVEQLNRGQRLRHGMLVADAYDAAGHPDSALAVLEALRRDYPTNRGLERRLAERN